MCPAGGSFDQTIRGQGGLSIDLRQRQKHALKGATMGVRRDGDGLSARRGSTVPDARRMDAVDTPLVRRDEFRHNRALLSDVFSRRRKPRW